MESIQYEDLNLFWMQAAIRRELNPLFKLHAVVFRDALPRTASNKLIRRVLRDQVLAADSVGRPAARSKI